MAEDIPKEVEEALSEDESSGGKSKKTLFIIVGAVVVLVGGLSFAAMSMLGGPPADEVGSEIVVQEAVEEDGSVEVSIESFNCTNRSADPGSHIHVIFDLWALVSPAMAADFRSDLKDVHKSRVKQAVEEIIRGAELRELDEHDTKSLKRKMKESINKVMGRSYVSEMVIIDYRTM